MSGTPGTSSRLVSAIWALGILLAGALVASLESATVISMNAQRDVRHYAGSAALFGTPYVLCAVGVWLGRRNPHLSKSLKLAALAVVVGGLPAVFGAAKMVWEYSENGVSKTVPAHLLVAFVAALAQYPLAVITIVLGLIGRFRVTPPGVDRAWR